MNYPYKSEALPVVGFQSETLHGVVVEENFSLG